MFEVGFSELLLIFVIALIVLGPERLPKLVSQVGRWAGKARAMARQFREQLESEVNLEELNKTAKTPSTPAPPPAAPYSAETMTPHHPAAGPAVASAAAGASASAAAATADASPAPDAATMGTTHEDAGAYPYAPASHSPAPYETPEYAAAHAAAAAPVDPDFATAPDAGHAPLDDTPAHAKVALPPTETHERGI